MIIKANEMISAAREQIKALDRSGLAVRDFVEYTRLIHDQERIIRYYSNIIPKISGPSYLHKV